MQVPEFAVAGLNLLECIISSRQALGDRATPAVLQGLECTINCCKCPNKDVAISAVSCLRTILYCMVDHRQDNIPFIRWAEVNGNFILQSLVGKHTFIFVLTMQKTLVFICLL